MSEPFGKERKQERRCVGTGAALAPSGPALRFVQGPDGILIPDLKGNLPGRGAWLTPTRDALIRAIGKGGFARSFKGQPKLPEGETPDAFADRIAALLEDAALSRLGLARKAGTLAIGNDAVRKVALKAIAYLTPQDASAPETEKLANLLHKAAGAPHLPLPTGRETLSRALGQDAVHIALLRGGPSKVALESVILWRGFTG